MTEQSFTLHPFPTLGQGVKSPLDRKLTGSIARHANTLTIQYALEGASGVVIAAASDISSRQHRLWQTTCFEFFLGIPKSDRYWEFNLSPTGHWNIYRFDGYRQGMQEETAIASLPFSVQLQPNTLSLALQLDLDSLVSADQGLEVAITAVIEPRNGEVTYWALTHLGAEADFHRRDSFTINL